MSEKTKSVDEVIKATKEGRLYIKNSDFFDLAKVQQLVDRLKKSTIYQEIEENKKSKLESV